MAFIDAAPFDTARPFDPYRNEAFGLALSALMPLAAAFLMAGLVAFLDAEVLAPLYAKASIAPFYLALFPLWGAAHWFAAREGAAGHDAANWILGLIAWGLVYPFLHGTFDAFWLGWANVFSLVLVAAVSLRLAPVSRPALFLVLPSLVWIALAAIPGYVLVTNGWSPGFAVTLAAMGESDGD
jgi:hypothetical protein